MRKNIFLQSGRSKFWLAGLLLAGLAVLLAWSIQNALAHPASLERSQASPMHPTFALLDADGTNVFESGQPVSTLKTCGSCHDTEFIASHSDHADIGLDEFPAPGETSPQSFAGLEMNCFLCHTQSPNNKARIQELKNGGAAWASTATLLGTGIVTGGEGEYTYVPDVIDASGNLLQKFVLVRDPSNTNCGQCHGNVHVGVDEPYVKSDFSLEDWRGDTTGQVFSPQRMSDSGLNLAGKEGLSHTWDVHAERLLQCTDCHYSLNNPVYTEKDSASQPEHLTFDPRRLDLGEYLKQPVHQFARGGSGEPASNVSQVEAMRRCDGCHSIENTHNWLPYKESHVAAVSCETCHIPKVYSAAFQQVDWTVLKANGDPRIEYRGISVGEDNVPSPVKDLITGYAPALISRQEVDGGMTVAPFNLVSTWYWVAGEPPQPVSTVDLRQAWLEGENFHPEVVAALDENGDGVLADVELALDSPEKAAVIAARLEALGLSAPQIVGEVQPYKVSHTVTTDEFATRECKTCHSEGSRLAQPVALAGYIPGGVVPEFTNDASIQISGEIVKTENGGLVYQPSNADDNLYILGHNSVGFVDLFGSLAFVGVLLGVAVHGTMRFLASLRQPRPHARVKRVYMYAFYERLWHWLQTFTILGLLFTGLIIHKPDTFGIFSFRYVVLVHNVLAAIVVGNAALSLFYHLVSGEIRQYLPRPAGFFDQAIVQAIYYIKGIFKGEPHPFEKTPDKKLNPLQQMTYFSILNVLLPLQVITGALMWGVQRWPDLTARLGGLPFLAPFHTLIAWLFGAFIVGHVYLTTTGHKPLASLEAMVNGWDELEDGSAEPELVEDEVADRNEDGYPAATAEEGI